MLRVGSTRSKSWSKGEPTTVVMRAMCLLSDLCVVLGNLSVTPFAQSSARVDLEYNRSPGHSVQRPKLLGLFSHDVLHLFIS